MTLKIYKIVGSLSNKVLWLPLVVPTTYHFAVGLQSKWNEYLHIQVITYTV